MALVMMVLSRTQSMAVKSCLLLPLFLASCDRTDGIRVEPNFADQRIDHECVSAALHEFYHPTVMPSYGGDGWEIPLDLRRSPDDDPVSIVICLESTAGRRRLVLEAGWIGTSEDHLPSDRSFNRALTTTLANTIDAVVDRCAPSVAGRWSASCTRMGTYHGPCPRAADGGE